MQHNRRETVAVFGLQGMGKTRFMQSWVDGRMRVISLEGGFKDEQEFPGVKVSTLAECLDYLDDNADLHFRVRFTPTPEEFPIVCEAAYELGACTLLMDEAWQWLSVKVNPVLPHEFIKVCKAGRHQGKGEGVSIIVASDCPSDFPPDLRRCIQKWIIFNTAEPADVDWLAKLLGSRDLAERCKDFPVGHYLEYERGVPGVKEYTLGGDHGRTLGSADRIEEKPEAGSGVLPDARGPDGLAGVES